MSTGTVRRRRHRKRVSRRIRAEERLLDRLLFPVDPDTFAEFSARLDAPGPPNERLCRTMHTRAPWEDV